MRIEKLLHKAHASWAPTGTPRPAGGGGAAVNFVAETR